MICCARNTVMNVCFVTIERNGVKSIETQLNCLWENWMRVLSTDSLCVCLCWLCVWVLTVWGEQPIRGKRYCFHLSVENNTHLCVALVCRRWRQTNAVIHPILCNTKFIAFYFINHLFLLFILHKKTINREKIKIKFWNENNNWIEWNNRHRDYQPIRDELPLNGFERELASNTVLLCSTGDRCEH